MSSHKLPQVRLRDAFSSGRERSSAGVTAACCGSQLRERTITLSIEHVTAHNAVSDEIYRYLSIAATEKPFACDERKGHSNLVTQ